MVDTENNVDILQPGDFLALTAFCRESEILLTTHAAEANCLSCSQKICHHLRNPNVNYNVHITYHRTNL